jgi:proteasome alpha subunit
MTMPMYVSPEQLMKDRADYARKGISRGRAAVASTYSEGVLLCAENPSKTLRKAGEIYDKIGFMGVGKYSEFDQLRVAGIRHADLKGYSFSRDDVDARWLANQYAQILGQYFTHEMKPLEVEMIVAEIGDLSEDDQLFHLLYDGTVMDTSSFVVIGGEAELIRERVQENWASGSSLKESIQVATLALSGPDRSFSSDELEVALLSRGNGRRAFTRIEGDELNELLA